MPHGLQEEAKPIQWPPNLEQRWYSYKAPWSAKEASVTPEVPHRGSMLRFCDADNRALEEAYR